MMHLKITAHLLSRSCHLKFVLLLWTGPKTERLTILHAATHETELGDYDFCLSRSHCTDTDATSREQAATAGIASGTS